MNKEYIRVCALWHEACGVRRTKVIFRQGGRDSKREGNEIAYFMDREVYNAIPLMTKATPDDYKQFGKIDEAQNTDIYSNL